MKHVIDYNDATEEFASAIYSDDFRMKQFAKANSHVSDTQIINALEQELADLESADDVVDASVHLIEAQHYLDLLRYRNKERFQFRLAVNK